MQRTLLALTTLLLTLSAQFVHSQSLVHHWPFNETSGSTATDISGTAPGILTNGPTWKPYSGKVGGALDLDGIDDRVDLGAVDLFGGTGITLAAWVKPGSAPFHEQFILAKTSAVAPNDHSWTLSIVNTTALQFRLKTAGTLTTLTTPGGIMLPGAWYHVTGTYDGNQMKLYLSGALVAFTACNGGIGYAPNSFASIGDLASGAQLSFKGLVDEVQIYDAGLSAQQVHTLVLGGLATAVQSNLTQDHALHPGPWMVIDAMGRVAIQQVNKDELPTRINTLAQGYYTLRSLDGQAYQRVWNSPNGVLLEQR